MANPKKHLHFQDSEDESITLENLGQTYKEDEYGYVQPQDARASQALIAQLPSRHLDALLLSEHEEPDRSRSSLRRKDSHYRTLQLKNATLNSRHRTIDADKIYEILNADPDATEDEKMKTLREMHQSLTIKRLVKQKLDADREKKIATHALGGFVRCKLSLWMTMHRFWYELKNVCYYFEPWHTPIKTIQGQFGSCVSSYFIFLRWLLYLNLCNFFIMFCFVVIPEMIQKNVNKTPSYLGNKTEPFEIHHLLTGSGWLMDSLLYFGAYSSEVVQPINGLPYNIALAYLCSIGAIMLINLIAVSVSITSSYQKNYVDTAGEIKNIFCNKIFSAWDYAIETETAAQLQKRAFCNDIKEILYAKRLSERKMTLSQTVVQKVSLLCVSLFSLAVVGSVGYLTYYLLYNNSLKVDIPILQLMTFAITVTLISSVFYYLLKYATIFEAYLSKKLRLYLTMIRVVLLRTVMLGIVTYFWMMIYKPPRDQLVCYEAELGSEFYRLILVNFLMAVIIFTFFGEFVRKLIHVHCTSRISLKEFDVAYNTLDLVYFQTLAWLAIFCVPLISLINIIILVLLFYIKKTSMFNNCRPPKRSWSVNEMQTFYLILTFIMFFFAALTVGYTIFALETSYCGPFSEFKYAGDVMKNLFHQKNLNNVVAEIIKYVTSPSVLFAVFCALCLAVHYMIAQANALISVIKKIRETLILASKDKVFLLKLFDEAFDAQIGKKSKINEDRFFYKNELHRTESNEALPGGASWNKNNHKDIIVNEGFCDYSDPDPSVGSPSHLKHRTNYLPADVPVNKLPHNNDSMNMLCDNRSPRAMGSPHQTRWGSPKGLDSPYQGRRGSPFPLHQPGFRHVLSKKNHT